MQNTVILTQAQIDSLMLLIEGGIKSVEAELDRLDELNGGDYSPAGLHGNLRTYDTLREVFGPLAYRQTFEFRAHLHSEEYGTASEPFYVGTVNAHNAGAALKLASAEVLSNCAHGTSYVVWVAGKSEIVSVG